MELLCNLFQILIKQLEDFSLLIIAVIHTTKAVVKLKPEKSFI